ncbi:hypothetical protein MHU86_9334 [Fragilaria crotonensis]|nr:hypothetical protein MHU86_9334 [Fragilaria crotonensis]
MQLRLNDVKVNDVPRFLTDQPTELTHSLVIPIEQSDTPYVIPLSIIGVASSFPTRKPTREEYDQLPHIILTSEAPDYDPHDPVMPNRKTLSSNMYRTQGTELG